MGKRTWILAGVLLVVAVGVFAASRSLNRYQEEGRLGVHGLQAPVTMIRDEKGMASIHAQSLASRFASNDSSNLSVNNRRSSGFLRDRQN